MIADDWADTTACTYAPSIGRKKMAQIPHIAKKQLIRSELLKCATAQPTEFPTYAAFASRVGMPTQGPWKGILDAISREETRQGLPDITFVLVNKRTGYPSQIGFTQSKNLTPQLKAHARTEVQKVIDYYNPGTPNPF
jgi:hypothetical protein